MNGWFRTHRQIIESPVFADAELLKLWIWILAKSSSKTRHITLSRGRGTSVVTLGPGQCVVGREKSAEALNWKPSTFRDRLKKLVDMGMISVEPDTHWSVVSVTNWAVFQSSKSDGTTPNRHQTDTIPPPNRHQTDTNKKVKKVEKEKKVKNVQDSFEAFASEQANELDQWIDQWNRWHAQGLVSSKTSTKPNKGVLAGWKRVQSNKELRSLLVERNSIEAAIRSSDFVRGTWFTLEKLFGGTNKEGAFIAQKLLDGCYRQTAKPARTANTGPGVTYSPEAHIGDPNYGRM